MEVGEDALDPLHVVQPPLDPVSICPQQHKPCRADTNSGKPQKTSKTPLTGCQVRPPDSCTPMKLKALWPHVPSHGRTVDQLECRLPWQSPRSIGLCDSLMLRFQCINIRWQPPRILSESRMYRFNCLTGHSILSGSSDSSGQSRALWSIRGPVAVADSWQGNQVPAVEIPQVVVTCLL